MSPTLLIMAAGMGSRYGGLKQLDPVGPGGEALFEYSIYDAIRRGFGKVVFVVRRDIEAGFRSRIGKRVEAKVAVDYVYQELDLLPATFNAPPNRKKPWGTGHAIFVAEEMVREPFAVINADNFYGASSFRLLGDYLKTAKDSDPAEYSMMGFVLRETLSDFGSVSRAVCQVDRDGFLQSVVELARIGRRGEGAEYTNKDGKRVPLSGGEIVSRNMWGFTPSIFAYLRRELVSFLEARGSDEKSEFLIPTVVGTLVARGHARVKVLMSPERGFGITYREDKPCVMESIRNLIVRGLYPERLWV